MKKKLYYILMADIIGSRERNAEELMKNFKSLTNDILTKNKNVFLSPITITLGDEFQSVIKSLKEAIDVIICTEETKLKLEYKFSLRYVLYHGEIDTPINRKIALEMYGSGLTKAREILNSLKKEDYRIRIKLNDEKSNILNGLFFLYTSIYDKWDPTDFKLICSFINYKDYNEVAKQLNMNRGQLWRKEKSLQIPQYFTIRKLINEIAK